VRAGDPMQQAIVVDNCDTWCNYWQSYIAGGFWRLQRRRSCTQTISEHRYWRSRHASPVHWLPERL